MKLKNQLKSAFSHPDDDPMAYRLGVAIWRTTITLSAAMALVVALAYLTEHGNQTPEQARAISLLFEILGYGLIMGLGIAVIDCLGPHNIRDSLRTTYRKARGILAR